MAGQAGEGDGPAAGPVGLLGAQMARIDHLAEHAIAGLQGRLGVAAGIPAVGGGQQAHQQGRFVEVEPGGGLVEIHPGGILKSPAHPQIHPVEVGEQEVALAEALLQLHRHEQLPPLALQGLALADGFGIEAAGQLLGEGAAALQHPATHQVGHQGPARADRIDAWVPPEAAVFAGQQGVNQHGWVIAQARVFVVLARLGRTEGPVGAVIEGEGTAHRGQPVAQGHLPQGEGRQP